MRLQRRAFSEEAAATDSRPLLPDVGREPRLAVASAREGDGEAAGGATPRAVTCAHMRPHAVTIRCNPVHTVSHRYIPLHTVAGGGGREVGDAAEISIMGELLFDCISVRAPPESCSGRATAM